MRTKRAKVKAWRGKRYEKSDVKKAVVTLVEGYQIRRNHGPLRGSTRMALKTYKPVTNGQRQLVLIDRSGLQFKGPPSEVA